MSVTLKSDKELEFKVREECSIEIVISCDTDLKKGDTVEFQFPNSWYVLTGPSFTREIQHDNKESDHYVGITAEGCEFDIEIKKQNRFFPEGRKRHGRLIVGTLKIGVLPAGTPIVLQYLNTFAPYITQKETLTIKVNDELLESPPALVVKSFSHVLTRIIAPSTAEPGEEFEVIIVHLDEFYNCCENEFTNKSLYLSNGNVIAENISFRGKFKTKTSIPEEGIFRFKYDNQYSNAVMVKKGVRKLYWGDIHIHTDVSTDGQGNGPYEYARDISGLDFAAVCDHCEGIGDRGYEIITDWAETHYQPGKFVTIPADERNPVEATGHHNIYFKNIAALNKFRTRYDDNGEADKRLDLFKDFDSDILFFPHHTGISFGSIPKSGIGAAVDWEAMADIVHRPVIEIYSHHGQSEVYNPHHILAYEFNRMRNPERRGNVCMPGPYYAQDYLKKGIRIGFIGSSDDHAAQGGKPHCGIAGVFADELTREGIFDALQSKSCFATTGERILLDFSVNGITMGEEEKMPKGSNIKIKFNVWGTDILLRAEILRYRVGIDNDFVPLLSHFPHPESTDAGIEFEDTLETDTIYYGRVIQNPLEWPGMAWTSPIWIDTE